jgi:prepilin peptidase CpaA
MSKTVAITVLAISLAACVTDVRSRRIPNALTFSAAIAALIYQSASAGWLGAQSSVTGWLVGTALFLPFFLLGGMGAGDVKLLAALGAWLGPRETVHLGVYTLIAGGALGLVVALMRGYLKTAVRNVWNLVQQWCLTGIRPVPSLTLEHATGPRLAYALPIFAGTAVTLWLH